MPILEHGLVAVTLSLSDFATAMPMSEAVRRYAPVLKEAGAWIGNTLEASSRPVGAEAALAA